VSFRTTCLLLAIVSLPSAAAPKDLPPVQDVSSTLDRLTVLEDERGNIVVFDREAPRERIWFGDPQRVYRLSVRGSGATGDGDFSVSVDDDRAPNGLAEVRYRAGAYEMSCGSATTALTLRPPDESRAMVGRLSFHEPLWRRRPVQLLRDEYGVYYAIDRGVDEEGRKDHHIYVGWIGQLVRSPLKLVAEDSLGRVYSAANGTRRLVITGSEARYIEGSTERKLHLLDVDGRDRPLFHVGLGLYPDIPRGTPCDALLER
jgi:hypothetical protein